MKNVMNEAALSFALRELRARINPEVSTFHKSDNSAQRAVVKVIEASVHKKKVLDSVLLYDNTPKDGSAKHREAVDKLNNELIKIAAYILETCIIINKDLLNAEIRNSNANADEE